MRTTRPAAVAHLALAAALLAAPGRAVPCTSIMVAKGAGADGAAFLTYSADSHELYGDLPLTPAAQHAPGTLRDVFEWDTGKFLGRIPQPAETFHVVGNVNEHQVAIGESTFTGRKELKDPKATGLDYGSLMFIALERSRTARQAVQVITDLVAEHGYASTGESISISDPGEAWLLEIIGKGPGVKGAVWVARRVPEGHVVAHANQARIRTFPLDDPKNTLYAKDVISFAREKGWFKGKDEEFSFADTYAPLTFGALRFCEARVWSVFSKVAPSMKLPIDSVLGKAGQARLPLWVKAERPLAVRDVMGLMRDHFEGTPLDLSQGVGAGPYALPYRWRPLSWKLDGKEYLNERAIATQQTGFSFVAQLRGDLPAPVGGVLWFGVDDSASTVYVPHYCANRAVARPFAVGSGNFGQFSWDSAFWTFSFVANWAYGRYGDMIVDIRAEQGALEGEFLSRQAEVERAALALWKTSPSLARDYLTAYSVEQGEKTVVRWRKLGERLLWKYMDGNVRDAQGKVLHPAWPESWRRRIVQESGDKLLVTPLPGEPPEEE
jgi:dipeptidase